MALPRPGPTSLFSVRRSSCPFLTVLNPIKVFFSFCGCPLLVLTTSRFSRAVRFRTEVGLCAGTVTQFGNRDPDFACGFVCFFFFCCCLFVSTRSYPSLSHRPLHFQFTAWLFRVFPVQPLFSGILGCRSLLRFRRFSPRHRAPGTHHFV